MQPLVSTTLESVQTELTAELELTAAAAVFVFAALRVRVRRAGFFPFGVSRPSYSAKRTLD